MKSIALPVGILALLGTIVPPTLFMLQKIEIDPMKNIMLVACLAWFVTAPMWMRTE